MVDDRHEAYCSMFAMNELTELFESTKGEHSIEFIVYKLLNLQRKNPSDTIPTIIAAAKKELQDG